jgi:MFS family permease
MLEAIQLLPVWILLRLANGWCLAAIYTTAESWLNEHALDHQRARLIAVYVMVTLIAIAGGQVLYGLLPVNMLFTGAAVMMMLALVPVGLFCGDQPMALKQKKFRTASMYALPPIARAGSFLSGVVTGSLWTMAPLMAEKNSLEASSVSSVMMAIVIGGGVFQLPLGYLADLIGRVRVITAASLACTLVAVTGILVVPQNTGHLAIIMFLFGGTSLSLYALCAAEANAKSHLSRVEIATLFLLLNGAGSIVGAVMTGIVSNWTEAALYVVAALAMSMLLVYTAFEGATTLIEKLKSRATWPIRAQWHTAPAPEARAP